MTNTERVRAFFDHLNSANIEGFVAMYHPDGTLCTMGQTLISGRYPKASILAAGGAIYDAFPDGLTFTITGMTSEGDRVAVEAYSDGRHISGQHYHNEYHFLFRFKDGQVLELKEYMDTERVTEVLCGGQRPAPSEA
jgi:ketosteroid isomerase-like protein